MLFSFKEHRSRTVPSSKPLILAGASGVKKTVLSESLFTLPVTIASLSGFVNKNCTDFEISSGEDFKPLKALLSKIFFISGITESKSPFSIFIVP